MKAVIFSDTHGNMARLRKMMKLHEDADMFVHLGDGAREFEASAALYKNKRIVSVTGNCDVFMLGEKMPPAEAVVELDGFMLFFTHGHKYGVKYGDVSLLARARELGVDAVFYGHTHVPRCEYLPPREVVNEKPLYVVCPGSLGQPRVGKPSYAVAETYGGKLICRLAEI